MLRAAAPCLIALPKEEEKEEKGGVIDLISRINHIHEENHDYETSDQSESEKEPRVLEMTKRFGGARKKCIQKIKSNLAISKTRKVEEVEIRDEEREMKFEKKEGTCLPFIIFVTTPFFVGLLAWMFKWW